MGKRPPLAHFNADERQWPNAGAHQLQHFESYRLDHPADLAVFALGQHNFEPRIFAAIFQPPHAERVRPVAALHLNAALQLCDHIIWEQSTGFDAIGLGHAGGRIGNEICELGVVGDQQQPGRILIEPPDREQPLPGVAETIINRLAASGVAMAGDHALGFVKEHVGFSRGLQPPAVEMDRILLRAHPEFGIADHTPVHLETAALDGLLSFAARSHAEPRKRAIQRHGGFGRSAFHAGGAFSI